jgi:hypothetical protein
MIKLPSLPLGWQVASARIGARLAPLYGVPSMAQQAAFYRDAFPVAHYVTIPEITAATSRLKWTEDPWHGKLDLIKHPTFMEEAIQRHPDYAGDCGSFAGYWCVALRKNALADECWWSTGYWVSGGKIVGHAVCVFRTGDQWFHAGNWNGCRPVPIDGPTGYVQDFEKTTGCPVFTATMWRASGLPDDTLALDRAQVVRA